jgi:DNA-binding MarR family transcriptional regulator
MPDRPLEELSFYLGRAYYNYVGLLERELQAAGLQAHVRPGMGHVLFALFEEEDVVIKDLAGRTGLSPSTLSGMLARMEESGLIERRRDEADGRAVRVRLTPLGRSLEARCHDVLGKVNAVLCAGMGAGEVALVRSALARMVAAMREEGAQ